MPLSPEKKELIRTVASEATVQTLTTMGIDASSPIDVQKDMAHLRASRKGSEQTKQLVKKAVVPIFVLGALAAAWQGFGDAISELIKPRG